MAAGPLARDALPVCVYGAKYRGAVVGQFSQDRERRREKERATIVKRGARLEDAWASRRRGHLYSAPCYTHQVLSSSLADQHSTEVPIDHTTPVLQCTCTLVSLTTTPLPAGPPRLLALVTGVVISLPPRPASPPERARRGLGLGDDRRRPPPPPPAPTPRGDERRPVFRELSVAFPESSSAPERSGEESSSAASAWPMRSRAA